MPIGEPGWPELAACTASMQRVRIVLIADFSMGARSLATVRPVFMDKPFLGSVPGDGPVDRAGGAKGRGRRPPRNGRNVPSDRGVILGLDAHFTHGNGKPESDSGPRRKTTGANAKDA